MLAPLSAERMAELATSVQVDAAVRRDYSAPAGSDGIAGITAAVDVAKGAGGCAVELVEGGLARARSVSRRCVNGFIHSGDVAPE